MRDSAAVGMDAAIQQMLIGKENNNRRFFSKNTSARNITIEKNLIENTAIMASSAPTHRRWSSGIM